MFRLFSFVAAACLFMLSVLGAEALSAEKQSLPQTVHFPGPNGLDLVGYLFLPPKFAGRIPAMVLMHGRAGPYSSAAHGVFDASTLSKRHVFWGRFWADHGYAALLVDSFGPRGFASGFPIHSYDDRPEAVNEVTVRPLDAYAALAYLRTRPDIDGQHIALQGWSNGGSATLASMADVTLKSVGLEAKNGFLGGIAFYPACGLHGVFDNRFVTYAPVRVFSGDNDEEVSAAHCRRLVDAAHALGADTAITIYPGATHDFDDPGKKRQSVEANADAKADAVPKALAFVRGLFGTSAPAN